ncbi:MAG: hypothetical protein HKN44_08575 [Ilumatobacter sp.]|nr:hypothetical protein [Ilumatobacter sp.]
MTDRLHLHPFCVQLDREWRRLRRSRHAVTTARSWASCVEADVAATFGGVTDLAELVAATQRRSGGHGDRLMRALVELAQSDQLAGRVIVQRLLPGLISASAPYRFRSGDADPIQLAVGSLWIAISAYDAARRPRHVAASLISDSVYKAFRQPARRRAAREEVCAPHRFDDLAPADATDPLVELARTLYEADRAGVPRRDTDLLRRIVNADSSARVAADLDVTTRTVRNRRARAVRRVSAAVCVSPAA